MDFSKSAYSEFHSGHHEFGIGLDISRKFFSFYSCLYFDQSYLKQIFPNEFDEKKYYNGKKSILYNSYTLIFRSFDFDSPVNYWTLNKIENIKDIKHFINTFNVDSSQIKFEKFIEMRKNILNELENAKMNLIVFDELAKELPLEFM